MIHVCFVCLGNICRSPTAEGVFRAKIAARGLDHAIATSSAGTAGYHIGELADPRTRATARRRGVTLDRTARQFAPEDFDRFAYVIAVDRANHARLARFTRPATAMKLHLLRSFEGIATTSDEIDVPDPYYGGPEGFEEVFEICERACEGLLAFIVREHGLTPRR